MSFSTGPDTDVAAILTLLTALYGKRVGEHTFGLVRELINKHGLTGSAGPEVRDLAARDALLITYPDQVLDPGSKPLETLAGFCKKWLPETISAIHILPFYPWSSDDGFSVIDWLKVATDYGSWRDIAAFRPQFDLMFDAVFNHVSAQSDWFKGFIRDDPTFREFFVTADANADLTKVVRPRALPLLTEFQTAAGPRKVWTTFSADQVDLDYRNPAVLLAAIDALLFYARQGARFIRLDAAGFFWKQIGTTCLHLPQTHTLIQLFRALLNAAAPGVLLITETNVPHADNVSYFGDGTNEAQLVYNFPLPPLVLHAMLTGTARKLTRWVQSLTLPSNRTAFLNFLASHDGIGLGPARGILTETEIDALVARTLQVGGFVSYRSLADGSQAPYELNINYLDALSEPGSGESLEITARKFLTAQAIMLSLQGVPAIYFHSLFGSRGDRAGAEQSGVPRRINREKLHRAGLEAELCESGSLRSLVFSGHRELLGMRRSLTAFAPSAPQRVLDVDERVFGVLRESVSGRTAVLCLHNVSSVRVRGRIPTGNALRGASPGQPWSNDRLAGQLIEGEYELSPWQTIWVPWVRCGDMCKRAESASEMLTCPPVRE